MNSLFGDATTAAPTPATLAEAESFFSGNRSPVPSFSLGGDNDQADRVPDIDLAEDGDDEDSKPLMSGKDAGSEREGVGGWISSIAKRSKGNGEANGSGSGKYQRVGQDEQQQQQGGRDREG